MKYLTYQNQLFLGVIGIGVGHLLSWLTEFSFFLNLGWIICGMLFVIHPVWNERADENPHIKRYVRLAGIIVMLMGLMLRVGGGDDFWYDRISEALGVNISDSTLLQGYDDHSGFHGDGTMFAALEFSDDRMEYVISSPGGWNALPLPENLHTLVYGKHSSEAAIGPYIGITMPKVERGYWYFYDRQGMTQDDAMVLKRGSYNYTIAIYDADNDVLYYCEYDT